MGFFPILLGLAATLFMWFALVANSLKGKYQTALAAQKTKANRESEVLEKFEQVFVQLRAEFGTDNENLIDIFILKSQSADRKGQEWLKEIAQELEKILLKMSVSEGLGKKIEYLITLIGKYEHNTEQYRRAAHFYHEALRAGAVKIPARLLGYKPLD